MALLTLTTRVLNFLEKGMDKVIGLKFREPTSLGTLQRAVRLVDADLMEQESLQLAGLIQDSQNAARRFIELPRNELLQIDDIPVNPVLVGQLDPGDRFLYYSDLVMPVIDSDEVNKYLQAISSPTQMTRAELEEMMQRIAEQIAPKYPGIYVDPESDPEVQSQINTLFLQAAY